MRVPQLQEEGALELRAGGVARHGCDQYSGCLALHGMQRLVERVVAEGWEFVERTQPSPTCQSTDNSPHWSTAEFSDAATTTAATKYE